MDEIRFLYSVNPKKIIKSIPEIGVIRAPKSLYLTKAQVAECLKYGSVYRRFANEGINQRVTIDTIDRLHNEKLIVDGEYDDRKLIGGIEDNKRGTVIDTREEVEEVAVKMKVEQLEVENKNKRTYTEPEVSKLTEESLVKEETKEAIEEDAVEESEEEAPVEEVVEEDAEEVSPEESVEDESEEVIEEDIEEVVEEDAEEITPEPTEQKNYNNYSGKKKHKH